MQKLCCFPLNETPDVNVKVNCVSTCCASDLKANVEDTTCNDSIKPVKEHKKRSCCCMKKRSLSNPQANEREEVVEIKLKNE